MPKINTNGIDLYCELSGTGAPLVLFSGLGINHSVLNGLSKELSTHHTVLVFDDRGCGLSDMPAETYSIQQMAKDTTGLIESLKIEKASIIGVSMGGKITIEITLAHPDRVETLILISQVFPRPESQPFQKASSISARNLVLPNNPMMPLSNNYWLQELMSDMLPSHRSTVERCQGRSERQKSFNLGYKGIPN